MWQVVIGFIAHAIQVVIILALIVVFGAQIIADINLGHKLLEGETKEDISGSKK